MSVQRYGRIESSPPARMSVPLIATLPATSAFGGSSPISASSAVVLPQPDSPTSPSRSPCLQVEPHPLHRVEPAAVRQVEPDLEVPHRQQAHGAASSARDRGGGAEAPAVDRQVRDAQARVERVLDRLTHQVAADDHQSDRQTGGHERPPRALGHRRAFERVLEHRPPRDAGHADAQEGQRRLVEDRVGDREDRRRDEQRRHLRQDVLGHDPPVARAERSRPFHVHALADALHLGTHDARRRGPQQQTDHQDHVRQARAEHGRDDDHQHQVGDDQEVVGDPHQRHVGPAAPVAGEQSDAAADEHRHERGREPDDHATSGRRTSARSARRPRCRRCRASAAPRAARRRGPTAASGCTGPGPGRRSPSRRRTPR